MNLRKKLMMVLLMLITLSLCCCSNAGDSGEPTPCPTDMETESEPTAYPTDVESDKKETKFVATEYNTDVIVTAENTVAGSFNAWREEIVKNHMNNDDPTENAVIHSPFHKLTVNGVQVPVYTARCTTGAHSFAWIDISNEGDFSLDIDLELSTKIARCVVLPESRGGDVPVDDNKVKFNISSTGSFTFTFSTDPLADVTDPTLAPLTIMVSREEAVKIPDGYKTVEIEPGYHDDYELEFMDEKTVYVMKPGFHEISSIGLPSNSILLIERGAYIQVTDRVDVEGNHNTKTAIHADHVKDVKIISRGLLDCGKLQGGDNKFKHVVNTACSKRVTISGLTIINSNTWTICAYGCEKAVIENNLLLGYRTYSDGIMMSECTDCVGRNNFVRTGDDAIEFKGTGWWTDPSKVGIGNIYENNDIWTDKGAGYCVTWESNCSMVGMMFRNNTIGFAQPTWTERNTALDCLLGTNPEVLWDAIVFDNIEIYHVVSPNVMNIQLHGEGARLDNVTFKNITVKSTEKNVYAFRMHFSATGGSIGKVTLENINICGKQLTAEDLQNEKLFCNQAEAFFGNVTVK